MAACECYYDVEYEENDGCDCSGNKCDCSGNKIIIIYIKTEFIKFHIEYYVVHNPHNKINDFAKAFKHWDETDKTHFIFPSDVRHVLFKRDDNKWCLDSSKCDNGHAPYYKYQIHLQDPNKIISVFEQVRDILIDLKQ